MRLKISVKASISCLRSQLPASLAENSVVSLAASPVIGKDQEGKRLQERLAHQQGSMKMFQFTESARNG